jgi:hypothetical protein
MSEDETLMAFAQIAATFVGFAALVSVLNREKLGESTALTLYRLRVVVLASLVTIFGALTPVVLARYQLPEAMVFRASGILVLAINILAILTNLRWTRGVDHSNQRLASVVLSILAIFTVGPLLLIASGILPGYAAGFFSTFMAFALAQAAACFVLLLDTLIGREFRE